jgi:sec-independent protein translocase protein TatB
MDSFFGIGFGELVVILILAGLVMGPQRIRQVARTLGRWTGQLQGISREFARQLNSELDSLDEGGEMKMTMREMREMQREIKTLRHELNQVPKAFIQETKETTKNITEEGRAVFEGKEPIYKPVSRPNEKQENGSTGHLPKAIEVPEDSE